MKRNLIYMIVVIETMQTWEGFINAGKIFINPEVTGKGL